MQNFLVFWLAFSAILISGIAAAVYWTFKNKQFSNQSRARYLPLESYIPEEDEESIKTKEKS
jgi:nitrogen fixation-related uncharacterized protein